MYILSPQEMTSVDRYTIEEYRLPGKLLMELAGKGCFDLLHRILPVNSNIAVLCGKGNNGGDGLVIARWLNNYGYKPFILLAGDISRMSPETKDNYELVKKIAIPIKNVKTGKEWQETKKLYFDDHSAKNQVHSIKFTAYIDALFGIGFRGSLPQPIDDIISTVNQLSGTKISIDISSGLNASNGQTEKAFKADYTLVMAAQKYGHILGRGKDFSGKITTIDIGVPQPVWNTLTPKVRIAEKDKDILPPRFNSFHKGNYGKLAVIAGSQGYTGAAILACKAALKAGAGLISLFHPPGLETVFETSLTEIMTYTIDNDFDYKLLNSFDTILIGPGIRLSEQAYDMVDYLTSNWSKKIVLDADALNILAEKKHLLERLKDREALLTPHIGEFSRLSGFSINEILSDPVGHVDAFVKEHNCSLILKSSYRLYADIRTMIIDDSGNDGLATGGSGDVLAGLAAGLLSQDSSVKDAAIAASLLLGTTADKCAQLIDKRAITPSLIIEYLFKKFF